MTVKLLIICGAAFQGHKLQSTTLELVHWRSTSPDQQVHADKSEAAIGNADGTSP